MTARWRAMRSDMVPVCLWLRAGYRCDLLRISGVGFTCCKVGLVLITLREVLSLDVVRRGLPVVVAGADRLDVPVRWVHAVEVTDDVARVLRGGGLLLSAGVALPGRGLGGGRWGGAAWGWRAHLADGDRFAGVGFGAGFVCRGARRGRGGGAGD